MADTDGVLIAPNEAVLAGRRAWQYTGTVRPKFAHPSGPDEESVWDYPRPPVQEARSQRVEVRAGDTLIARTRRAVRVAETASAPTWYVPPDDVRQGLLVASSSQSLCEWKGLAQGVQLNTSEISTQLKAAQPGQLDVGWRYLRVFEEFANLHGWYAFYPQRVACFVDGERMQAQPGGYYGGWVAGNMTGPIKGEPGSGSW